MDEQHVEHYYHAEPPGVTVKLEKNSRGYGWEVKVTAPTMAEVLALVQAADAQLRERFGGAA